MFTTYTVLVFVVIIKKCSHSLLRGVIVTGRIVENPSNGQWRVWQHQAWSRWRSKYDASVQIRYLQILFPLNNTNGIFWKFYNTSKTIPQTCSLNYSRVHWHFKLFRNGGFIKNLHFLLWALYMTCKIL